VVWSARHAPLSVSTTGLHGPGLILPKRRRQRRQPDNPRLPSRISPWPPRKGRSLTGADPLPEPLMKIWIAATRRARRRWLHGGRTRTTRWTAVVVWALWGSVTTLAVFEFPTAVIVLGPASLALASRLRAWPEGAGGALSGAGAICVVIGLLNLGNASSCSSQTASCRGVAPVPVLVTGGLLVAAAGVVYAVRTRRRIAR
jgi:hypothetical protein